MMVTLVDKALLVKLFYLSHKLPAEALQSFRTQKGKKKGSDPITPIGLTFIVWHFEEMGSLCNHSLSGALCLSEVRTSNADVI